MNKKTKIIVVVICALLLGATIILGCYLIQFLRFFGWFYDGDLDLDRVGIGGYFEYDDKEVLKDIYTFTGKEERLYKYYYQENKETELIESIETNESWQKIENMDDTDFYFSRGIEKINKGYLFFYNYDYHNEVYDSYDYYHNIELGGTVSQFYVICAIDTENNNIWYLETKRIRSDKNE